jgi:hypothetical protein
VEHQFWVGFILGSAVMLVAVMGLAYWADAVTGSRYRHSKLIRSVEEPHPDRLHGHHVIDPLIRNPPHQED